MDINQTTTIVAGLKNKLGAGTQIDFAPGVQINRLFPSIFDQSLKEKHPPLWSETQAAEEFKKAVDAAKDADLAVMVLGENQDMSGEQASRSSLDRSRPCTFLLFLTHRGMNSKVKRSAALSRLAILFIPDFQNM